MGLLRQRLWLAILSLGLLGMGSFGGNHADGLPARDFDATITDVDGTTLTLTRVTVGGDASLEGTIGRGQLRIPFDNIARVQFEAVDGTRERTRATVTLREGDPITLRVRGSTALQGRTPGGTYQIRARDLRSVDFAP